MEIEHQGHHPLVDVEGGVYLGADFTHDAHYALFIAAANGYRSRPIGVERGVLHRRKAVVRNAESVQDVFCHTLDRIEGVFRASAPLLGAELSHHGREEAAFPREFRAHGQEHGRNLEEVHVARLAAQIAGERFQQAGERHGAQRTRLGCERILEVQRISVQRQHRLGHVARQAFGQLRPQPPLVRGDSCAPHLSACT